MTKITKKYIAGAVYLILGLTCFLIVWKMTDTFDDFLKDAISARGKVVALERVYDKFNQHIGFRPLVEFQTSAGVKISSNEHFEFRRFRNGGVTRYNIGDTVEVWYHENNPQKIMLVDRGGLNTKQAPTFGILGTIFIGFGIYNIGAAIKKQRAVHLR